MATQSRALVESMRRQLQVRHSYGTKSRAWCWRVWGDGRVRNKRVPGSYCQPVMLPFSSQDKRRSSVWSYLELAIGAWWPTHEQTTEDNAVFPPNPPAVNSSAEKGRALWTNPCLTDKPSLARAQQIPISTPLTHSQNIQMSTVATDYSEMPHTRRAEARRAVCPLFTKLILANK